LGGGWSKLLGTVEGAVEGTVEGALEGTVECTVECTVEGAYCYSVHWKVRIVIRCIWLLGEGVVDGCIC
jgi:hypothetical protein